MGGDFSDKVCAWPSYRLLAIWGFPSTPVPENTGGGTHPPELQAFLHDRVGREEDQESVMDTVWPGLEAGGGDMAWETPLAPGPTGQPQGITSTLFLSQSLCCSWEPEEIKGWKGR